MSKGYLDVTISCQARKRKLVHELTDQRRRHFDRTVTKTASYFRNAVHGKLVIFVGGYEELT